MVILSMIFEMVLTWVLAGVLMFGYCIPYLMTSFRNGDVWSVALWIALSLLVIIGWVGLIGLFASVGMTKLKKAGAFHN